MERRLVIGLDGGQTTTLALCATLDGTIVAHALAGPANHYHEPGGRERLESAITEGINGALALAGAPPSQVAHVWLGMTGAIDEARSFGERLLPAARVNASHDVVTALAGASAGEAGVIVICGTGSIAYGQRADGLTARAGGWGYLMGDEGSGYDLGIQALRAATQSVDGRGAATELAWRVPQRFGLADLWAVHRAIYAQQLTRGEIASLARTVSEAAHAGDAVALRLLESAGTQLADMALAVVNALDDTHTGMNVYTTGGVFAAGDLILGRFREQIMRISPTSRVLPARFAPAVGALLLALRSAGIALDTPLLERIAAGLPPQAQLKGHV
jgi:N-acetylglucosamine kinase-like BadF-type ATPase